MNGSSSQGQIGEPRALPAASVEFLRATRRLLDLDRDEVLSRPMAGIRVQSADEWLLDGLYGE